MSRPVRIIRVDGSVLADCLYLIGQALVKLAAGDDAGGNEDLAAAERLVPAGGVRELLRMVSDGELPAPGPDPDAMDAWLEVCRMAGAGELVLIRILSRPRPSWRRRSGKLLFGRLDELRAAAERRMAAGELGPPPEMPPERPPPWEDDSAVTGLSRPGSLSGSLRRMGLM